MQEHSSGFNVTIDNISDKTTMLALQGPKAEAILDRITDIDITALWFHGVVEGKLFDEVPTIIARTGYPGEDGFELFLKTPTLRGFGTACWKKARTTGFNQSGLGRVIACALSRSWRCTATR